MVAESMVILLPICQVGWASASAGVARVHLLERRASRNGPPLAVRMTRVTSLMPAAVHRLEDGGVLGIDRQDA